MLRDYLHTANYRAQTVITEKGYAFWSATCESRTICAAVERRCVIAYLSNRGTINGRVENRLHLCEQRRIRSCLVECALIK